MNILFIEHNIGSSKQFYNLLEKNFIECNIISCPTGEEALEFTKTKRPDIIIMDIRQPCIDSLVVLKILKKKDPDIYLLMSAAPEDFMWLQKAVSLGIDDYLLKPFQEKEFILRIKKAIRFIEKNKNTLSRDLKENDGYYRKFFELIPSPIIIHSEKKIVFANTAAAKLLNITLPQMIVGKSLLNFIHPELINIFQKETQQLIKDNQEHKKLESKFVTSDGTIIEVELILSPFNYQGAPAILTIIYNITERKRIEAELQKADRLESIGILTSGIAHDFNNFLATMLGNIALAKTYKDNPDKIYEKLDIMEKATLQAKELTRQLLTLFKGEEVEKKVINLKDLITNSASFALSGSNISFDFSFPEDLLPLKIDVAQMGQVISNMIINAVQAMPQGGKIYIKAENVVLEPSLKNANLIPLPEGKYVKISVKDEGIGIPAENLQKIFEPFFSTKPEGSGLGLATSHAIIKKYNGYINVISQVGVGTTFEIYLPAAADI